MGSIWTVEKVGHLWACIDEDGADMRFFKTEEEATEWLSFQQDAAEMAAEGDH